MTNSLSAISFLRTIDLENENKPLKSIKKYIIYPRYIGKTLLQLRDTRYIFNRRFELLLKQKSKICFGG